MTGGAGLSDGIPFWSGICRKLAKGVRMSLPVLIAGIAIGHAPGSAGATELWLSGVDPFVRGVMRPGELSDYTDLFKPDAPWTGAAARTAVFKTSTQWIEYAPDAALARMFEVLRNRHIALAMEGLMIRGGAECGRGVEGYSSPDAIRNAALRIRRLGGELAAVAMDEPLWFGHHYEGAQACRSSIAEIARNIAGNVAAVTEIFPGVAIGDIEPVSTDAGPGWTDEIMQWVDAYRAATGRPLAFFHADVIWDDRMQDELPRLAGRLRAAGIAFGVIYNGDPQDDSDIAWTDHAEAHFETLEAGGRFSPDQAILQTWMARPRRMLPEGEPGTMTHLVLPYARPPTLLTATIDNGRAAGRLTDLAGRPVVGARISLVQPEDGRSGALTERRLGGTVPQGAARAVIGLRLDAECDCSGDGEVGLGAVTYSEGAASAIAVRFPPLGEAQARPSILQEEAIPDRPLILNSMPFEVAPDQSFRLSVAMRASPSASQSGYLAIIFLDAAGREIRRIRLPLEEGEIEIAAPTTDMDGRFSAAVPATARRLRAVFAGDAHYRRAADAAR